MKLASQYAIIRFMPYAEIGEFANVGVALACPATGYFDACLMPVKKTGRITGFFEQLDKRIYREAMGYLREELERLRELARARTIPVAQIFNELTRPREALLRFSETRAILADLPEETLRKLFARFVERDFANKEYHDHILERGVRETLRQANLRKLFERDEIGNEDLHVQIPFVHRRDGRALLAIKPLDLAKEEANKVYDVGGHWVDRVRRLNKHGLLPDAMLFAVNLPLDASNCRGAAEEIVTELREEGMRIATMKETEVITAFAGAAVRH